MSTAYRALALAMFASAASFVSAPALADEARAADARVEQTAQQLAKAQQTGDAVTIADAKARYEAAKAVAWGQRHPARTPSPVAYVVKQ